jgi:hypothetical protein
LVLSTVLALGQRDLDSFEGGFEDLMIVVKGGKYGSG